MFVSVPKQVDQRVYHVRAELRGDYVDVGLFLN